MDAHGDAINLLNIASGKTINNAPVKGQCAKDYILGRAGQRKTPLSPRAGTGDAAGLSGMSRPQGAAASLTTGSSTGQGAALTGYRKVMADAHAQIAEARARREAGRTAMGLASHGGDLSGRSFAPVGGAGAVGRPASHATPGGAVDQDQLAASPFPSHTAADALYPRPHQHAEHHAKVERMVIPQHICEKNGAGTFVNGFAPPL